ncbi:hypothetical protein [Acrocarpospora sp. B8E8]
MISGAVDLLADLTQGTYSSLLPDLAPGAIRDLRDPDASHDGDDED